MKGGFSLYNSGGSTFIYPGENSGFVQTKYESDKHLTVTATANGKSYTSVQFDASWASSVYSDLVSKPTVDGIFGLCLIRAYQA